MGHLRNAVAGALALLLPAASPSAAERLVFVGPWPDRFTVLNRGRTLGTAERGSISQEESQAMMADGQEPAELEASLGGTV